MPLQPADLRGVFPALITPFDDGGERIDEASFAKLVEFQLKSGVSGLVACGSTGEALTLSNEEYSHVIRLTRKLAPKVPLVAGISLSSTAQAVEAGQRAKDAGAEALLIAAPPYNKPQQEGLYRHVAAVVKATSLPVIAYNIPGRSAVGYAPATIARLANDGLIIGVKDSTGSLDAVLDLIAAAPPSLRMLSGEDSLIAAIMANGGVGTISASANVAPAGFVAVTKAAAAGDFAAARKAQLDLLPLIRALFLESNPVPAKAALWLMGVIASPAVRLPLVRAGESTVARLKEVLKL